MQRNFARALALVAVTVACAALSSAANAAPNAAERTQAVNVRFTVFPAAIPSLGVYIADAMGFFARNNIDIEYVNVGTGSSALQVLVGGNTDFIISDVTGVALARRNTNTDIRFVSGQFSRFMGALQCRPNSGVSGSYPGLMRQLEGKRIGITAPGSSTDTYLRYSMIAAGANPARASIVPIGGVPQLIAAMQAGSVDCITSYQPIQRLIGERGRTVLNWASGQGPAIFARNYSYNAIATTGSYARRAPGAVRRVSKAMREAIAYGSNPRNASTIAARTARFFPGLDQGTLERIIEDTAPTLGYKIRSVEVANATRVFNTINPSDRISYPYQSYIAPTMLDLSPPTVLINRPVRAGNRVTFTWRGVDLPRAIDLTDRASGVRNYVVQSRTANGRWVTRLSRTRARTLRLSPRAGAKVQIRVRAIDRAGNTGRWVATRPV